MSIGHWNTNGWHVKDNNVALTERIAILEHLALDIVCINESHLIDGRETIEVPGYIWHGYNRTNIDRTAIRGSGGVGILVKRTIAQHSRITILDSTCEGILWMRLQCKYNTDLTLLLCTCYLPPERSSRGDNAQAFYDALLG